MATKAVGGGEDTSVGRRRLLKWGAAMLAAAAFPIVLQRSRRRHVEPLGALRPAQGGLIELLPGFSYRVIDRAGEQMSDGHRVPGMPDGMGCFAGANGTLVLMRNHELHRDVATGAYTKAPPEAYDAQAFGGVTRVVLRRRGLERVRSNLVLAGTLRNCAGGPSKWGWLTAEESIESGHGYVFRCSVDADSVQPPDRILGYGRFNHEAVCVDPASHVAYLTEDQPDGCLYRFVPDDPGRPFEGKLQALVVSDAPRFDIGTKLRPGQSLNVRWTDVLRPRSERDDVRYQAQERGAAIVRRGEGAAFDHGCVYVCATIGGAAGLGQILRLSDGATPKLEVLAESEDDEVLNMPDNIVVSPHGDVYLAEDGMTATQYVRGITPNGRVFDVARHPAGTSEFAGVCFSPDGETLFLNLQADGVTLAISGPFSQLSAAARG